MKIKKLKETEKLLRVVHQLRKRCPWDKKQTHRSLIPYLVEEAYETIDAINNKDPRHLKEELGDLLLQIALHAEISSEKRTFNFEDVARSITEKMIRRHSHVFGNGKCKNLRTHLRNWNILKMEEKPKRSLLEGIPRSLPSLPLAQRYGEIAAGVGFDFASAKEVIAKVKEEISELEAELKKKVAPTPELELELGDILFAVANLGRHLKLNSETALRKSSRKYYMRFTKMEKSIAAQGKKLSDCNMLELEAQWQRSKGARPKGARHLFTV